MLLIFAVHIQDNQLSMGEENSLLGKGICERFNKQPVLG
jgi:hypothetical protein